jgi:Ca-activated chloride channel family protein
LSFFGKPELLFLIPIITGILGFVFLKSQNSADKKLRLLVASKFIEDLVPLFSKKRKFLKFLTFIFGFSLLVIALAEPQWGENQRSISPKSIDILIAVDLSKSMLARDVKPNRLERVKLTLNNLLPSVQGDRLGLIGFSGTAFVQCPLTLDHQAFTKSLNDLQVGLIPVPGTNLAKAIEEAQRTFSSDDTDKFLILISDGEDLEGQGLSKLDRKKGLSYQPTL